MIGKGKTAGVDVRDAPSWKRAERLPAPYMSRAGMLEFAPTRVALSRQEFFKRTRA